MFSSASRKPVVLPQKGETKISRMIQRQYCVSSVTPVATRLLTAHLSLRNASCVASKGMKLETAAQVHRSQEDKIKMVALCSVGK